MDIRNENWGVACVAPFSSPVSVIVVRSFIMVIEMNGKQSSYAH